MIDNLKAIKKLIVNDADFWNAPMTEGRVNAFAEQLQGFVPEEIYEAQKHFRNEAGRTRMPMPADLKDHMSGFPSAEEMFALLPRSEADSAVVTDEGAIALGACRSLLDAGDFHGARLAFNAAYETAVSEAKRAGKKAKWFASLGFDMLGREKAVLDAIDKNRITVSAALDWVPHLQLTEPLQRKLELEGSTRLQIAAPNSEQEEQVSEEQMEKNRTNIKLLLDSLKSKGS
jgi:hypothetical protein